MSSTEGLNDRAWSTVRALIIFVVYLATCLSLTLVLLRDLFAYAARSASPNERRRCSLFSCLAILSLGVTWYYMIQFFCLSYRAWAFDHIQPTPGLLDLRLGQWLRDVTLFRDAWEVVTETHARLFWSQPIFFITAAWSLFLSGEGAHRQVRNIWVYMMLGQLVAISFAMNLFFVALSLSPTPAITRMDRNKETTTALDLRSFILCGAPAGLTAVSVLLLPFAANTTYFLWVLALPHLALFLPLIPYLRRRIQHEGSQQQPRTGYNGLYLTILVLGCYAQINTMATISQNPGESHLHRHSRPLDVLSGQLTKVRDLGAVESTLAALHDHPAVSSVGWDTLLCTLSFVSWYVTTGKAKPETSTVPRKLQ